jgi:hypothetical protein
MPHATMVISTGHVRTFETERERPVVSCFDPSKTPGRGDSSIGDDILSRTRILARIVPELRFVYLGLDRRRVRVCADARVVLFTSPPPSTGPTRPKGFIGILPDWEPEGR